MDNGSDQDPNPTPEDSNGSDSPDASPLKEPTDDSSEIKAVSNGSEAADSPAPSPDQPKKKEEASDSPDPKPEAGAATSASSRARAKTPPPPPPAESSGPRPGQAARQSAAELAKAKAELAHAESEARLAAAEARLAEAKAKLAAAEAKNQAALSRSADDAGPDPLGNLLKTPSKEERRLAKQVERAQAKLNAEKDPIEALLLPPTQDGLEDDSKSGEQSSDAVVVAPIDTETPPAAAAAPAREEQDNKVWLIALAFIIVGGLAWYFLSRPEQEPPTVVTGPPVVQPTPIPAAPEPEPEPEPAVIGGGSSTGGTSSGSGSDSSGSSSDDGSADPPDDDFASDRTIARVKKSAPRSGTNKPKTKVPAPYDDGDDAKDDPYGGSKADCVFNPNAPGCVAKKEKGTSLKNLDATLPDKLSNRQLSQALGTKKSKIKTTCGAKHNPASGEVVRVKLSIEGGTGKVMSAQPQPPHNNPLGQCVADVLKTIEFPRFTSSQQGTTYPVTF